MSNTIQIITHDVYITTYFIEADNATEAIEKFKNKDWIDTQLGDYVGSIADNGQVEPELTKESIRDIVE